MHICMQQNQNRKVHSVQDSSHPFAVLCYLSIFTKLIPDGRQGRALESNASPGKMLICEHEMCQLNEVYDY